MCARVMDHLRELSELPPAHNPHPYKSYKSYKDAITLAATGSHWQESGIPCKRSKLSAPVPQQHALIERW